MARHGENIHRRKDGRWEGRYIKAQTTGQKILWGYVYGKSYAEARERLTQKKEAYRQDVPPAPKLLFSELAEEWLASVSQRIKESTLAHYHYTLSRYLLPVFGALTLTQLDERQLEHGLLQVISPSDASHRKLGASSARECLSMLRRICKYAAHLHLMQPVEIQVSLPPVRQPHTHPLSLQEQKSLRDFVWQSTTPRKAGLLLQMQLGLRIGEVCGLQWGDLDLEAGLLTVRRTVTRIYCRKGCTKVVIQSPKTISSEREIPLPDELVFLLKKLRGQVGPEVWFLSGKADKPVEPRCYRRSIQRYLHQAAVKKVHPHALRHTFATTCLQCGCDVKTLSEILGHADPNITLRRYVHSSLERKRKELNRIFAAVWVQDSPFGRSKRSHKTT